MSPTVRERQEWAVLTGKEGWEPRAAARQGRAVTWLTRDMDPEQGEQSKSYDSKPVQPTV